MTAPRATVPALLAAVLTLFAADAARAQDFQWPDEAENLEVLPDSTGPDRLRSVMQHFTDALGVQCSYCHTGEGDLSTWDFAADDKEHKEAARVMMRMVQAVNNDHLPELEEGEGHTHEDGADHAHEHGSDTRLLEGHVTCTTCHRGTEEPRMIEDIVTGIVQEAGVDSAVAKYRALREQYYGGFAYDFRAGPLSEAARRLARSGNTEAGLRLAELETEYHPESYRAWFARAQIQRRAGRTDAAIASLERSLENAPERAREFLQRQLERLRGGS